MSNHPFHDDDDPQLPASLIDDLRREYAAPRVPARVDSAIGRAARQHFAAGRRRVFRWLPAAGVAAAAAAIAFVFIVVEPESRPRTAYERQVTSVGPAVGDVQPSGAATLAIGEGTASADVRGPTQAGDGQHAAMVLNQANVDYRCLLTSTGAVQPDRLAAAQTSRATTDHAGRVTILEAFALARQLKAGVAAEPQWDQNHDGVVDRRDVDALAFAAVRLEQGS